MLPQGAVIRAGMLSLKDGRVLALTESGALEIGFRGGKWTVAEIARADLPLTCGKAVVGDFLYAASDKQLVRCRILPRR